MAQQRKQITVLLLNIKGLSALAEKMGNSQLVTRLWQQMNMVVQEFEGKANPPAGNNTIAVFGAPIAHENDPERAIQTAVRLLHLVQEFNEEQQLAEPIRLRIAVNTGSVLFSTMGIGGGFMAIGDPVNVATGLLRATDYPLLLTHDTYRHVRGVFEVTPLPAVELPGKAAPVEIYEVLQQKVRSVQFAGWDLEGVETRMVGREAVMTQLKGLLHTTVATRQLQLVLTIGEAGLGKSRLLHEFTKWIELLTEFYSLWLGRANQQTHGQPYGLMREMFVYRFDLRDSDPPAVVRQKLETGFTRYMGEDDNTIRAAHFVGQLLGFDFSSSPYLEGVLGDARQLRDQAFTYVTRLFTAVSYSQTAVDPEDQDYGLLLFLEDLQWADIPSLQMLEHIRRSCVDAPVLIFCLARPEFLEQHPEWDGDEKLARLDLTILEGEDSRELVTHLLQNARFVPDELVTFITSRAEGNPFYIEELIKMLIEDKVIIPQDPYWDIAVERLAEVNIPVTLTGLLQASLDGLDPLEKETLQRAAVIGRIFWDDAITHLAGGQQGDNLNLGRQTAYALQSLRDQGIIIKRNQSAFADTEEHRFKHAMLQEVIYQSTLKRLRREYHELFADWLVQQSGERAQEYAGLIGEHYERADMPLDAANWYGQAGKQARETHAYEVAFEYIQRAIGLVEKSEDGEHSLMLLPWYFELGQLYQTQAKFGEAAAVYEKMKTIAQKEEDRLWLAKAWLGLSQAQERRSDYQTANQSASRALDQINLLQPVPLLEQCELLHQKGWMMFRIGKLEEAVKMGEETLAIARKLGDKKQISRAMNLIGVIYTSRGMYAKGDKYLEDSLVFDREIGNKGAVATKLSNLGETARLQGDYAKAAAMYQEALTLAQEVGDIGSVHICLNNLGGARVGMQQYEQAIVDLQTALEGMGEHVFAETYEFLAMAYFGMGDQEKALELAQQSLIVGYEGQDPEGIGNSWRTLGVLVAAAERPLPILAKGDQLFTAESCFRQSCELFAELGHGRDQAWSLREWARYELAQGDKEAGEQMWQQSRQLFVDLSIQLQVQQMDMERPPPSYPVT